MIGEVLPRYDKSPQRLGEVALFSNARIIANKSQGTQRTRNMAQSKEQNKSLETDPKERKIYELIDKEFKITTLKISVHYERTQITKQNQEKDT